ncbi:MAG TPA: hypothetical protein VIM00_05055 [Candidatus Acidoferrum sp.]
MMGKELKCRVRFGKQESEGRALLETSEIIFRGDFRLKMAFAKIQSAKVMGEELQLKTAEGAAHFTLGAATAKKWCEKILHPKSRIEKLGVKAEARVALLGFTDGDGLFEEVGALTKNVSKERFGTDTEWIFLNVEAKKELERVSKIAKQMGGSTALWVVYPKGQKTLLERMVLEAGRAAGLKDVKVVGFSATHTALKFVIPVANR